MLADLFPLPLWILAACIIASPVFIFLKGKAAFKYVLLAGMVLALASFAVPYKSAFFELNSLSGFFAQLYLLLSVLIALYAPNSFERLLLIATVCFGLVGAALTTDFFTFYVFFELIMVSTVFLIYNDKIKGLSLRAARKYLLLNIFGSVLILFGMAGIYSLTGAFNTVLGSGIVLLLIVVGLLIKSAILPFHTWLVDAHSIAPHQSSALLSGAIVTVGFLGILKFLMFGTSQLYMLLALLTSMLAGLIALREWNLKRLLALSTLIHMGFILFAISLGTPLGTFASLVHIFNHGFAKALAFLAAGVLISSTGKYDLKELAGFGRSGVGFMFLLGLLSVAGIPPLNSFVSEFFIVLSGIQAGQLYATIFLLVTWLIALTVYLRILYYMYIKGSEPKECRTSWQQMLPLLILAALVVLLGIYPEPLFQIASAAIGTLV